MWWIIIIIIILLCKVHHYGIGRIVTLGFPPNYRVERKQQKLALRSPIKKQ